MKNYPANRVCLFAVRARLGEGWFPAATQFVQLAHMRRHWRYVHVGLFRCGRVVEAGRERGVVSRTTQEAVADYVGIPGRHVVLIPAICQNLALQAWEGVQTEIGNPYDSAGPTRAGLDFLEILPGIGKRLRGVDGGKALICSSLVAKHFGVANHSEVTPAELCDMPLWFWPGAREIFPRSSAERDAAVLEVCRGEVCETMKIPAMSKGIDPRMLPR